MEKIIAGTILFTACVWVVLTTIVTLPLELEYKWQSWAIVAWGPVIIVAGIWEIITRIFKRNIK